MQINFFTPVSYLNKKDFFTSLAEVADDYFYYGGDRAYVNVSQATHYKAQVIECETKWWKTALKVISLFTGFIPLLMLIIKAIGRCGKKIYIASLQSREKPYMRIYTHKKPVSIDHVKIKERYRKIFEKAGIEYSQATALQQHAVFFADENGNFTRKSMQKGFERLHFNKPLAFLVSLFIFIGLAAKTGQKNGVIAMKDIKKGKHSSDTGVFTTEGKFDVFKFENIRSRFARVNQAYLTAVELQEMRKANAVRDQKNEDARSGAFASGGEFNLAMSLFSDGNVVDKYGNIIPTISFSKLRDFYVEGPKVFEEAAAETM